MSAPGIMPGLERVEALLNRMGNPEKKLPCVHVAGTNGKGSTVVIIAGILRAAGLRVGSFMSPPLHSIREMITINGVPIAVDSMITCLEEIEADIKAYTGNNRMKPSEFEILTALAFKYFVETGADFMVAEAGMGGLNDATNVVMPRVSVITPITLEHSAYLGGSLEAIAAHKAVYLAELICFVGLCVPALAVFLALAAALKHLNKSLAALGGLFAVVSEAVALTLGSSPQSLSGVLVYLSDQYVAAAGAQRLAIAGAAESFIAQANAVSAAGILTAFGILLLSVLMLKGVFKRGVAYLGILTGVLGMVFEAIRPAVGGAYAIYGLLLPVWFVFVGLKLYRLGRDS